MQKSALFQRDIGSKFPTSAAKFAPSGLLALAASRAAQRLVLTAALDPTPELLMVGHVCSRAPSSPNKVVACQRFHSGSESDVLQCHSVRPLNKACQPLTKTLLCYILFAGALLT